MGSRHSGPIATLARCLTVIREAKQMYLGGGVVAVAPIAMFLVSYLIYTQATFTLVATRVRAAIEAGKEVP